jgi:ubiquinone/menaquinone biosynthesis C-methylase UbiE
MFNESAAFYDALYFTFKDYAAEAADIARLIKAEHPQARTVLDVACGTGEHAKFLAKEHGFKVDGIDINDEFLLLARRKHPAGRFVSADMTNFILDRKYDAVICMFSSIGYVRTLDGLKSALDCFQRHLAPGGVVIVEPWFPPEKMTTGYQSERSAEVDGTHVHRLSTTEITGRSCMLRFDYTITRGDKVRTATEHHELGLFTEEETLRAFEWAGLRARHEAESPSNRGLYIARAV